MAVGKRMFAIFFTTRGLLEFVMLPAKHTVTSPWYTEICLPKVFQAVERFRPKSGVRGMKFHHDNAPAHTAGKTKEFLRQSGLEMIEHLPYSPDLAPCDFWLFPNLKRHLKGSRFESVRANRCFLEAVECISASSYSKLFDMWSHRCQREYFEHLE